MSNPNQAPFVEAAEPGVFERLETAFRNSHVGQLATLAVASFGIASAAEAYTAEPVGAEGSTASGQIVRSKSSLSTQSILNKIHAVIPAHDSTEHLGVPVVPTAGFLEPSAGSFKANCKSKYAATFRYFKITPEGVGFKGCGTWLGIPLDLPTKSTPGQFQGPLNQLGNRIQASVRLSYAETTTRIGGSRKKIKALYQCPVVTGTSGAVDPTGVESITLKRQGAETTASIKMC